MVRLRGKLTIFQMVGMTTGGIIGVLIIGDTKWEPDMHGIEYEDDEILALTFNTAWSPPQGVISKLRDMFADVTFQCFYDEPGCEIAGYY